MTPVKITFKYKLSSFIIICWIAYLLSITNCAEFIPNAPVSSPADLQSGSAYISINVGEIGTLAKQKTIDLERLILTLSCSDEDTIRDTTALSGTGGNNVQVTIGDLAAPKQWRVAVVTYDQNDSCIHSGAASFTTEPADTIDVSLDLSARYSMLRVSFNGIPDSALMLSVSLDGAINLDTTLTVADGTDTAVLSHDYLSASVDGTDHFVSMKARGVYYGINTILYSADTSLSVVSGEDKEYTVTLKWVGPYINNAPVFTSQPSEMTDSVIAGSVYRDTVHVDDPDGDEVILVLDDAPAAMTINDTIIQWSTESSATGTHTVSVIARDGNGGYDTLSWTIRIIAPPAGNHSPMFTSLPADMRSTIYVDSTYVDTVHATDADGDQLTFSFLSGSDGMTLEDSIITWTPTADDIGLNPNTVLVDDGNGGKDTLAWNIQVSTSPQFPVIPYDSVITGVIDPGVDVDRYQFYGTAGDLITLRVDPQGDGYSYDPDSRIQVLQPDGSVFLNQIINNGTLNSFEDVELPVNGLYTIRVMESDGDQVFNYDIALYSLQHTLANGTAIDFGVPVSSSLISKVSVNRYLFNGTEDDLVMIRVDPTGDGYSYDPDSRLQLVASNGTVLLDQPIVNGTLNTVEDFVIPADGQYIVRVMESNGDQVFNYDIALYSLQHTLANGTAIDFGVPVSSSLISKVSVNRYLFNGTEDDLVMIRVDPTGDGYSYDPDSRLQLVASNGTVLLDQPIVNGTLNTVEDFVIPADGQYIVRVMESNGDQVFNYDIALYSLQHTLANGTAIDFVVPVSGSLISKVSVNRYLFNGTEDDLVMIRVDPTGDGYSYDPDSRLQLVASNGTILVDQPIANGTLNTVEDFVIPADGQYIIRVMESDGDQVFNYDIALYSLQHTLANGTAIDFAVSVNGSLASKVTVDRYIFTGNLGTIVTIRVDPTGDGYSYDPDSRLQLVASDGTVLLDQLIANGTLNTIEDFMLPATGQYIIRVMESDGDQVFDYSIILIN